MHSLLEALIGEIQTEAATTRKVLEALPDTQYSWRPHEKSMTAGALATHLATFPQGLFAVLTSPSFDINNIRGGWESLPRKQEVLKSFDEGIETVCQGLSKMSEDQANELWAFTKGEQILAQMPRIFATKTLILNHMIHHRGQLSVYLRLLDVPVPSIYGPSADVNPFA